VVGTLGPIARPSTPVPRDLRPMLATPAKELPVDDGTWAYEMKWDGMRSLVGVEGGAVWLTSRAGNDATARFPEIAPIADALSGVDALLDGELVALDEAGVPSFEKLQPRMQAHGTAAVRERAAVQPVVLMLFDVLWLAGHSTCELPYTERRALLERLALAGASWQTPPTTVGGGDAVLEASRALGLEGVVAKRIDSPYRPGRRADSWRKVKTTLGQELVVGGWLPGAGRLEGQLGSLLVGHHDDEGLRFAGRVGSGIDAAKREQLERALAPLRRDDSPFLQTPRLPSPRWVEPELVVEVAFHEWTSQGVLRAPRYKGLRDDKPAIEVVRET
jgi:bifunctional non-homologous end joining protein LigD